MIQLKDDERLDYLLAEDMKIVQSPTVFAFSLDAVLLSKFAYVPIQKGNIIDLCTGNGIVPLLQHPHKSRHHRGGNSGKAV